MGRHESFEPSLIRNGTVKIAQEFLFKILLSSAVFSFFSLCLDFHLFLH